jgi:ribosomal peptide maturation radical SAM protein 1
VPQNGAIKDAAEIRVALVCMPWGPVARPSLAVALLKECVRAAGFRPDVHFLNVRFAEYVGLEIYEQIALNTLYAEWFFSQALFGPDGLGEVENCWDDIKNDARARKIRENLAAAAGNSEELCEKIATEFVRRFIDQCLESVDWSRYVAVGFTTTFAQSLASLLLAKKIKERWPGVKIVMGGANVESEMGVEFMRAFDWVDYVVHGEGEKSFPALLQCIAAGDTERRVAGVSMRKGQELLRGDSDQPPVVNLDESPMPDYSDYVGELERSGLKKKLQLQLFYESSRGCWWGAKHHCTFCGLNGSTMSFRHKEAAKICKEISELSSRYQCLTLAATDNILAMEYFKSLLPQLAEMNTDIELFYEVKANLAREQVEALSAAGIRTIQPGIESLSSRLLKLMRKGTSAIQNIQLLKWCYEFHITPLWNILYGMPGEAPEDYKDLPYLLRLLSHLQPPADVIPISFERFSPYFFDRDKFGLSLTPLPGYQLIYPAERVDIAKIAYFFEGEWEGRAGNPAEYMRPVLEEWRRWTKQWEAGKVFCQYSKGPSYITIRDSRPRMPGALPVARQVQLDEKLSAVYLFCDEGRSFNAILAMALKKFAGKISEKELAGSLNQLVHQGLMFREGDRYLSLAVRRKSISAASLKLGAGKPAADVAPAAN